MNGIYDNYLENSTVGVQESVWKIKQLKVNYSKFFPADKEAAILDIGVGNGEMLHLLKDSGYINAEGADISKSAVNACVARGYRCTLTENTVDFLRSHPGKFAMISMFHVIEHISKDDIIPVITACYEALTDDGVLILETPNMASHDAVYMRYVDFTHVTGYTEPSLRQMLMICGFRKMTIFGTDIFINRTLSNLLLRILNKIYSFVFRLKRRLFGLRTAAVTELFLSAVAYRKDR